MLATEGDSHLHLVISVWKSTDDHSQTPDTKQLNFNQITKYFKIFNWSNGVLKIKTNGIIYVTIMGSQGQRHTRNQQKSSGNDIYGLIRLYFVRRCNTQILIVSRNTKLIHSIVL